MVANLRHVGIVVKNEKIFLNFFTKIGFKLFKTSKEDNDYMHKLHKLKNLNLITYKLKNNSGMIELLKFKSKKKINKLKINSTGINHIALTMKNLDKFYLIYKKKIKFLNEPKINPENTAKVCFGHGPENLLIEFVEEI